MNHMPTIARIKKRDSRIVKFDQDKITEAIWNAAKSVGGKDRSLAKKISNQVVTVLEVFFKEKDDVPTVEQIQDLVEKILIENGHAKTAKAYILYRQKQSEIREQKSDILGEEKDTSFSVNALRVLQERYLQRDENGSVAETPEEMFKRVAKNIASADKKHKEDSATTEKKFYEMMTNLDFLPNSPTLMNAGTPVQQLAACFVLPVNDNLSEIFESVKKAALIQQTGGGTGFNFSNIRPRNDMISTTKGYASGPVSFIKIFDETTNTIKQAGKRRGANMAILNVNHPDILEFIASKEKQDELTNFNISVGVTDKFMEAVEKNTEYELINPRTKKVVNVLNARSVFEIIVTKAWSNGEPGIVFLDRLENDNPTPKFGKLEATNPCGEQPLLDYEACNLGSINLANFVKENKIDFDRLKEVIHLAVHFLDNSIDVGDYKIPEIKKTVPQNRKIGLGVMGFADLLFILGIPYDSEKGVKTAERIMDFIETESKNASEKLGTTRGSFPNFAKSKLKKKFKSMRNATVTTIAPTGSISMIAEVSSGIEPAYALVYAKHVLDGSELLLTNKQFEIAAKDRDIYSHELMRKIAKTGTIKGIKGIPLDMQEIFVTSAEISPIWHIKIQAAFQSHTDNAVSKTINFSSHASIDDVRETFLGAYKLGCKGITIYRDKSRDIQVLSHLESHSDSENDLRQRNKLDKQTSMPFIEEPKSKNKDNKMKEIIPPPITNNK
ncbi:adenosylcobalamin-dependent ribonucleoside-diphosphate reductase [Pseudomonadota bacterium]